MKFTVSNMKFEFPNETCWEIDGSKVYDTIRNKGVKMADFVVLRNDDKLFVVEAKSSAPHFGDAKRFNEFIGDVYEKLTNALTLVVAMHLERYPKHLGSLPPGLQHLKISKVKFYLILVVNNEHIKDDGLGVLTDALRNKILPVLRCWGGHESYDVYVYDECLAQRKLSC